MKKSILALAVVAFLAHLAIFALLSSSRFCVTNEGVSFDTPLAQGDVDW